MSYMDGGDGRGPRGASGRGSTPADGACSSNETAGDRLLQVQAALGGGPVEACPLTATGSGRIIQLGGVRDVYSLIF